MNIPQETKELLMKVGNLIQQMASALEGMDEYGDLEMEIQDARDFADELADAAKKKRN